MGVPSIGLARSDTVSVPLQPRRSSGRVVRRLAETSSTVGHRLFAEIPRQGEPPWAESHLLRFCRLHRHSAPSWLYIGYMEYSPEGICSQVHNWLGSSNHWIGLFTHPLDHSCHRLTLDRGTRSVLAARISRPAGGSPARERVGSELCFVAAAYQTQVQGRQSRYGRCSRRTGRANGSEFAASCSWH